MFKFLKTIFCYSWAPLYFGGSSSDSQTTNQYDQRKTIGNGAINAESGSLVSINNTTTDGGAVHDALASNTATTKNAFDFGAKAFDFGLKSSDQAASLAMSSSRLVSDAYADAKGRGALTDKILMGTVAGALVIAALAMRKK